MNPFLFLIPVTLLALSVAVSIILVKKGKTPRRAMAIHFLSLALIRIRRKIPLSRVLLVCYIIVFILAFCTPDTFRRFSFAFHYIVSCGMGKGLFAICAKALPRSSPSSRYP